VFSIAIAVPKTSNWPTKEGRRQIVALDKYSHFSVVLTNLTDQPQRISRSSGWPAIQTLHFEGTDAAGKKWEAQLTDRPRRHRLCLETLAPHECLVFDVEFANPEEWDGFPKPLPYGESQTVTMRAVFNVDPSTVAPELKIWTGQVESPPVTCEFDWRMPEKRGGSRGIGIVAETGKTFGKVEVHLQNQGPDENPTLE
jgi:hypothetical protein